MKLSAQASLPHNAVNASAKGYVENQEALIALDIKPGEIGKIPPVLINELNAIQRSPEHEKARSALRTAIKILMDYTSRVSGDSVAYQSVKYRPEEWIKRMEDPPQPENGNEAQQYRFTKQSPNIEGADHLYLEFKNNKLCFISVRDGNGQAIGNLPENGPLLAEADKLPVGGKSPRSNSHQNLALMAKLPPSSTSTAIEKPGEDEDANKGAGSPLKRAATGETTDEPPPTKRPARDINFLPRVLTAEQVKETADSIYKETLEDWEYYENNKSKFNGKKLPEAAKVNCSELRGIFYHNAMKYEAYKAAVIDRFNNDHAFFENVPQSKKRPGAVQQFVLKRLKDVDDFVSHLSSEAGIGVGEEGRLTRERIKDVAEKTEKYRRATFGEFYPGWDSVNDFFHWLENGSIKKPEKKVNI